MIAANVAQWFMFALFAWFAGAVCPVPIAGPAAQGVGGGHRMGCFIYGFS
jgi:hypothetical protein